jgi:predicted enzyme related to lactoylglutathione lyase
MPTLMPFISTPDLARMRAFYENLLGAEEVERYPEEGDAFFVAFRIGDSTLGLVSEADTKTGQDSTHRVVISVEVDDVDALVARVEDLGGSLFAPPNDMPWGQRVGHIYDPDGNMLNLTASSDK